jgi:cellulose synthase/poly-beta-1,6-N-acetylglucosamine synthase-like glycosyltransferase
VPVPELTVVLSTLGNHPVLRRVLDGYDRQDAPAGSFELIVVSDVKEPDVGAVEAATGERSYPVRRLTGHAPGLSANRNTGWAAAQAPIVLFTDNDTIPVRRLVSEHLATHRRHPADEVAVSGHVRWAKGLTVTPFMKWLDRGVQFGFQATRGEQGHWAQLYGANSSIKVAMLERVGGYDEERLPYLYEDLDWGYRAREHGLRVIYNRRAIVDHWRPMSVGVFKQRLPMLAATELQFTQLHPEVTPWYHQMFSEALTHGPAGVKARRLAGVVPPGLPWLGRRVWDAADLQWRQELAPTFMAAWDEAQRGTRSAQPDVAVLLAERSMGASPGGPK